MVTLAPLHSQAAPLSTLLYNGIVEIVEKILVLP